VIKTAANVKQHKTSAAATEKHLFNFSKKAVGTLN
jgi:hypothetical protein